MIDGKRVNIHLIGGSAKSWICLQGTILTLSAMSWGSKTTVEIPLEKLTMKQGKQFNGQHLIYSIVIPVFIILVTVFTVPTIQYLFQLDGSHPIFRFIVMNMLLMCSAVFLYFLFLFCMRRESITIRNDSEKEKYSFWNSHHDIQSLIAHIQYRKKVVDAVNPYPIHGILSQSDGLTWKRFMWYSLFLTLTLNWLGILIILLSLSYFSVQSLSNICKFPYLYRKGFHYFNQKEYIKSSQYLQELINKRPDYLPAKILHIRLLIQLHHFYQAERELVELHFDISPDEYESILIEIRVWERIWMRKALIKPLWLPDFDLNSYQADGLRLQYITWN